MRLGTFPELSDDECCTASAAMGLLTSISAARRMVGPHE